MTDKEELCSDAESRMPLPLSGPQEMVSVDVFSNFGMEQMDEAHDDHLSDNGSSVHEDSVSNSEDESDEDPRQVAPEGAVQIQP